jgi:uncharacterized phiE125 gp8 family phage protein
VKRVLVTAPTDDPVSVQDLKSHLRLVDDDNREDYYLESILIPSARDWVEKNTWRRLMTQTWEFYVNQFVTPGGYVYTWDIAKGQAPFPVFLPYPPVQSISSVTYLDPSGASQTLSTSVYELGERNGIGIMRLKYGQYWPAVRNQEDSCTIRMVCGYGSNPTDVPASLRHAILLLASHGYWNREAVADKQFVEVPYTVEALVRPFKVQTRI